MIGRFKSTLSGYPRQFWVLFFGTLVSASGNSLVWPFMAIYVHEKLGVPLTVVGVVLAANAAAGLLSQVVAGPMVDRFGRKIAMTISLSTRAVILVGLGLANSLGAFVILVVLSGFFGAMYNPGLNAMVADIVQPEKRMEAYGLIRIVANLGIAIGPAIGGFIATRSYLVSFLAAATSSALYFLIISLFVKETKPEMEAAYDYENERNAGYGHLMRDYHFLLFCLALTAMMIAYVQMMTIFPVYIKDQYQVIENQFGLIMATNAAMVVVFQYPLTRIVGRYRLAPTLASGALFTALGVGMVAFSSSFATFLLSMVVLTIGELIFAPSSIAFVAKVAPETMRGRYMGVYGMSWGVSFGLGPIVGGMINDNLSPVLIWPIMASVALVSAVAFLLIGRIVTDESPLAGAPAAPRRADIGVNPDSLESQDAQEYEN
ncbi:MAG: MFS transporter [Anaerolineae bacterium]|nr:MFS transporter [Anaerolineae bacterium]NIQ82770.1 MFS transporter [Anaerolineae bacterium]